MANEIIEGLYRTVLEDFQKLKNAIDQHEALQKEFVKNERAMSNVKHDDVKKEDPKHEAPKK